MKPWVLIGAGLCLAAATASVNAASPADKPYTIGNYPVEAQAKDAVAAKEKAHADGQQAAFRSLLKRLVPVTAYASIDRLRGINAAEYVDGVAIRAERNSSTTYIASLDFAFEAAAVRDLLRREGVPFIDEQALQVVLVPVMRETSAPPSAPEFRPASATWNDAWKDLDLDNTLTPVKLAPLAPDVQADAIRKLVGGEGDAGRVLAGAYGSDRVLVAVAEIDTPAKRVNVTLVGTDAVGPINWKRSYRVADGDTAYAMELASVVSLGVLEGRWKAVKSEAWGGDAAIAGSASVIELEVEFGSLAEWNDIRRRVLETRGVDNVEIGAVSARSAEMSLRYPGGGQPLSAALARQGLTLRNDGTSWLLRASF